MKNLLFFLLIFIAFGCGDKCDDLNCQNGGFCEDEVCKCQEGYEGDLCEIQKVPSRIILSNFTISVLPFADIIGNEWDDDGTGPDLALGFQDSAGESIGSYLTYQKEDVEDVPVTFDEFSVIVADVEAATDWITVYLYDADPSNFTPMATMDVKPYRPGEPFETTISSSINDYFVIEMDVDFEF